MVIQNIKKMGILFSLGLLFVLASGAMAAAQPSTLKDQQSVSITVYNSNVGLVKETRLVNLQQGVHTLKFMDVPRELEPASVSLKSLIDHTARNEKIKVKIGEAFDVASERIQTDFKQPEAKVNEVALEVSLRNQKNEDIKVFVEETIPGDWEMISNTHSYDKIQANLIRFIVPVAKGQEAKVRYKVRMRY